MDCLGQAGFVGQVDADAVRTVPGNKGASLRSSYRVELFPGVVGRRLMLLCSA